MNGVNLLATKGENISDYRLREKNHLPPTGKILTDYGREPTEATNAIIDQKCKKPSNAIYTVYTRKNAALNISRTKTSAAQAHQIA